MAGGGGGARPSDKAAAARAPTTTAIRSTIQSIKEVVGGHSEADIYDALRESNMDPNETAQKLLNQDPFHEVKRKRDKKKEIAGQKNLAEPTAQFEQGSQWMKPHTQRIENDQRRPYNHGQTSGPSREFRVVRDNRHGVVENRSEQGHKGSAYVEVSDRSVAVVQSDRNRPPFTPSEGRIMYKSAKQSYNSDTLQAKRGAQGTAQRHARPYSKHFQNEQNLPTSDPAPVPSNHKAAGGTVAIRRQVGVVNAPRQYSGRADSHTNMQRGNFASAGPSGRPFMSRNIRSIQRPASDTVFRGRSVGRPFDNQNVKKYHQVSAGNQKATQPIKEWKPKSANKSSIKDSDNGGTDAVPASDSKTENANVLDVNGLCEKLSHANIHENVIIPEHLRVPDYEQTRLRFGSFTPGAEAEQLSSSTPESEESEQGEEPVQLVFQEDTVGAGQDESDDQAGSGPPHNISTSTTEISSPPSEDGEMNDQEVENDDGLGLVQSDTPLGVADGQNIQSTSSLTAFSAYGHEDSNMHQNNEAQLYGLVDPNVHQQVLTSSSSQGYPSVEANNAVQAFRMPESNLHSQVLPSTSEALNSQFVGSPVAVASQQQFISQTQQAAQMYPPVHMQHYPNFMPYRHHLYPPVYVPPMAMPNYSTNVPYPSNGNNYLQMPGGGSHLTAGGVKYGVSQYKPVPAGNPSGYGNYTHPAGFTLSSPGVIGAGAGVDDVNRMKYKDNNIYAPTPQVEASDIWIQTPREITTMQCPPPYYNLSGQATPGGFVQNPGNASFNATAQSSHAQFPGLYHPQQPPSIVSPHPMVHQQVPSAIGPNVGVGVAAPAPQVGAYQQPQLGHMNWRQPNF